MSLVVQQVGFGEAGFAQCFAIRMEVFVGEQNVPLEEERDTLDAGALHFLASENGEALGTARVLLKDSYVKITRVAVLQAGRGKGVGAALMRHIEVAVPHRNFRLDAQVQALAFYERLGYVPTGEIFMENGIPHRHMVKTITPEVAAS